MNLNSDMDTAEWDVPHWMKTRLWDFLAGIFVAVAASLATSDKIWSLHKIRIVVTSVLLTIAVFKVACILDEGEKTWRPTMAQSFTKYIWNCRYTGPLTRWLKISFCAFVLFIGSIVWSALR